MENQTEKALTEKQKAYYKERVEFFRSLRVAIPYGIIYDTAISMTDEECDEFLSPSPNVN